MLKPLLVEEKKTQLPALEEFTMQLGKQCKKIKGNISSNPNTHISTRVYVNLENTNFHVVFRVCANLLTMPGIYSRHSININN